MNSPITSVTPAGRSETPLSKIAVTAPASKTNFPFGFVACASQSRRDVVLLSCAWKYVPNSWPANDCPEFSKEVSNIGIPADVAILAASTLVTIPPLPTPELPAPPRTTLSISEIL